MVLYIDLDGTLIDVRKRHYLVFMFVCTSVKGGDISITPAEYWEKKREGFSDVDVLSQLGIDISEDDYIVGKKKLIESPFLLAEDRLFEFTTMTLSELKRLAHLILISQRANPYYSLQEIRNLGIDWFFDKICFAPSGSYRKHEPLLDHVTNHLPSKQVLIGDTEADFVAAEALGIESMLVDSGARSRVYLRRKCGRQVTIYDNLWHCLESLRSPA